MKKGLFLVAGFVAGVIYLVACGGTTSSIAETIGNAIDVIYDNTTSGLSATNVQAAIDEVAANQTESVDLSTLLPGTTWNVTNTAGQTALQGSGQIVFSSNETFTLTGPLAAGAICEGLCEPDGSISYELVGSSILYATYDTGGNPVGMLLEVLSATSSSLVLTGRGECASYTGISTLTKVE